MSAVVNTQADSVIRRLSPAPPGLILFSLLIWGWQTDFLVYAAIMAVIIELPYLIKWRLDFSDKDINQLADLSGILFLVITIYAFNNYTFQGIYKVLELVPFALLLLILAQKYSHQAGIKTSALFISIRRLGKDAGRDILYDVDISLPYVFICLVSASSGNKQRDIFFFLCLLIVTWIMWHFRSKHFSIFRWLLTLLIAFSIAFVMQFGLTRLQAKAEVYFLRLFDQYGWKSRDPSRISTAIGELGRLKLSDRIVMRVKSDKPLSTPLYFRETAYSIYGYGTWRNPRVEFDVIAKTENKNHWLLNQEINDIHSLDIGLHLQDQSIIIPAPDNINSLFGKDIVQVETNPYGAIMVDARSGWINYRMGYADVNFAEKSPDPEDLMIPANYSQDFETIATRLDLYSKPPEQIIETVENHFRDNFYYSITQNQRYPKGQYLTKFLFKDKKGHCEYFATATALLLREAGIPTRYSVGFSIQEYSPWQNAYIIRARHAHSWVEYYLNGVWQKLDTTPSEWAPLEAEDRTLLEPFMDFFSWLRYLIGSEDIEEGNETNDWYIWLLIPLGAYLVWRFYNKKQTNKSKSTEQARKIDYQKFGSDSPLYALIEKLEKETDRRNIGETLISWVKRVLPDGKSEQYINIINSHYRYRFNPTSNKKQDRQSIIDKLEQLL